jgi:hypothetical protein
MELALSLRRFCESCGRRGAKTVLETAAVESSILWLQV